MPMMLLVAMTSSCFFLVDCAWTRSLKLLRVVNTGPRLDHDHEFDGPCGTRRRASRNLRAGICLRRAMVARTAGAGAGEKERRRQATGAEGKKDMRPASEGSGNKIVAPREKIVAPSETILWRQGEAQGENLINR